MKAAVLRERGRFEVEDIALDGPRADEARIRVLTSGRCPASHHVMTM